MHKQLCPTYSIRLTFEYCKDLRECWKAASQRNPRNPLLHAGLVHTLDQTQFHLATSDRSEGNLAKIFHLCNKQCQNYYPWAKTSKNYYTPKQIKTTMDPNKSKLIWAQTPDTVCRATLS